ncbi:hypothetical protein BC628DRAFT_918579 [Trametes gibbosa]|nr:hypothetical protein BC628DRAFT_918579 [Trametes gibbosa]
MSLACFQPFAYRLTAFRYQACPRTHASCTSSLFAPSVNLFTNLVPLSRIIICMHSSPSCNRAQRPCLLPRITHQHTHSLYPHPSLLLTPFQTPDPALVQERALLHPDRSYPHDASRPSPGQSAHITERGCAWKLRALEIVAAFALPVDAEIANSKSDRHRREH